MGLGSFGRVSLAEARRQAEWARQLVQADTDPIKQRRLQRQQTSCREGRLEQLAWMAYKAHKEWTCHAFVPLRLLT